MESELRIQVFYNQKMRLLTIHHASGGELRGMDFQPLILWTSSRGSEKSGMAKVSLVSEVSDPHALPTVTLDVTALALSLTVADHSHQSS